MHPHVTRNNISWLHFSWATLYVVYRRWSKPPAVTATERDTLCDRSVVGSTSRQRLHVAVRLSPYFFYFRDKRIFGINAFPLFHCGKSGANVLVMRWIFESATSYQTACLNGAEFEVLIFVEELSYRLRWWSFPDDLYTVRA